MRHFFILFLIFAACARPQSTDTLKSHALTAKDTLGGLIIGATDTLSTADSLKTKKGARRDTLKPVGIRPLSTESFFIKSDSFRQSNYKSAYDLFSAYPLSFVKDFSYSIQPNDLYINGSGRNTTAYLRDGVALNGNSAWYTPVYWQTEGIDSIEITPAARSFLYGITNSFAAVNLVSKEDISYLPVTRIRYLEGPDREGFLDAQYNSVIYKKFVLSFDVTTNKVEETIINSSSSIWQGNIKLKYFLDKKLDLTASYDFYKYNVGLTGGAYIGLMDSAYGSGLKDNIYKSNSVLSYDETSYDKASRNDLNLKVASGYIENGLTELNLFYRAHIDEYRQNEKNTSDNITRFKENYRTKILGGVLRQTYKTGVFNIDLSGSYQLEKYDTNNIVLKNNESAYALAGRAYTDLLDGGIVVSAFGKTAHYNSMQFHGIGADATLRLNDNVSFYFGLSVFNSFRNTFTPDSGQAVYFFPGVYGSGEKITTKITEGGAKYMNDFVSVDLKAVYRKEGSGFDILNVGSAIRIRYGAFQLENNTAYNSKSGYDNSNYDNYTGPSY